MKVFLDFEASSLADRSYPIEVAWVFQDGRSESHLIAPAPSWSDWDPISEAIHGIARETLVTTGRPPEEVADRMLEVLSGHELFASAPSWDGKWLSALLRAGGHPRHSLRLRDTDEALWSTACEVLRPFLTEARLQVEVHGLIADARPVGGTPAHRALPDAQAEHDAWVRVRQEARRLAATFA